MCQFRSSASYRRMAWRETFDLFAFLCGVAFIGGMACALLLAAAPMLEG